MQTANAYNLSHNQRFYSILIYLFVSMVFAALFVYAAYMLYTGMEKMQAYVNSLIWAANDQLNYCLK